MTGARRTPAVCGHDRTAGAVIVAVLALTALTSCSGTGESSYYRLQREEHQRYTDCLDAGGSYTHTEDAWGDDWSCTK